MAFCSNVAIGSVLFSYWLSIPVSRIEDAGRRDGGLKEKSWYCKGDVKGGMV